jgi:hypothetical protein
MSKSAIDAPRQNAWLVDPRELTIVGLDTPDGAEHPLYDDRVALPLDPIFVAGIRKFGILQAVKVRKDGDRLLVVAGRQRVRAARAFTDVRVPVMLERGDDAHVQDAGIAENEHRVNDTHEVKVAKLQRYLRSGRTEHEAAIAFKVTPETVRNWLTFAEAAPEVKAAVAAGEMSATEATRIARKPRAEQKAALPRPGKKQIKALTKADALLPLEGEPGFEAGFCAALKWVLGELQTTDVAGLARCLETSK